MNAPAAVDAPMSSVHATISTVDRSLPCESCCNARRQGTRRQFSEAAPRSVIDADSAALETDSAALIKLALASAERVRGPLCHICDDRHHDPNVVGLCPFDPPLVRKPAAEDVPLADLPTGSPRH